MERKIVQIVSAPDNLYALYVDDDGVEFTTRIVCIGLTNTGEVVMMDTCDSGIVKEIEITKQILNHEVIPD